MGGAGGQGAPSARAQAMQVVQATHALAKTGERDDLTTRLEGAQRRLQDPSITVLVVGEYKQGKSSLVNALLGVNVCPVDDDVATSVPTSIRFTKAASAAVVLAGGSDGKPRVQSVPVEDVAKYVTERGRETNGQAVESAIIGLPHQLLSSGLVLVDTPGVGGLGSAHTAATMAVLPMAQAVVLVSDASQEYTAPEMEFLRTARELCPNILLAMTKIDLYPEWRRIQELDRGHLERAGIPGIPIPLSSTLREHAVARQDQQLNTESGYPTLIGILSKNVIGAGEQLAVRGACSDVLSVVSQMEMGLVAEARALKDPQSAGNEMARMQEAKEEAGRLRGNSSRWQTTLADGFADLNSDLDFDMRRRTRTVTQEAENAIDESDPGAMWEEFDSWLKRRTAADVGENYALLAKGVEEIANLTAEHFEGAAELIERASGVGSPDEILQGLGEVSHVGAAKLSLGSHGMKAVQTAYSGFSMFGTLTHYAGLAMINPFAIGIGVLMAGKAVRDERQRALAGRRQQAKGAVRKYIDELTFQIGKDSKDAVRHAQRNLRDFFMERLSEMERSITEAIGSAQDAVKKSEADRQIRLKQVQEVAQRFAQIRKAVDVLAPGLAPTMAS